MSNTEWGPYGQNGQNVTIGNEHMQHPHVPEPYKEPSGIMPWLEVWIRPRRVVRAFLESSNPTRNMILIAWVVGMLSVLDSASENSMLDRVSIPMLLPITIIMGLIAGLIGLYLGAALFKWVGSWLGGTGTHEELRVAISRGYNTLTIGVGLLWIPLLLLTGKDMFTEATPRLDSSVFLSLLVLVISAIKFVLIVWSFVVSLHAIGEAHQFSAWKSLLATVIIIITILVIVVIFAVMIGVGVGFLSAV